RLIALIECHLYFCAKKALRSFTQQLQPVFYHFEIPRCISSDRTFDIAPACNRIDRFSRIHISYMDDVPVESIQMKMLHLGNLGRQVDQHFYGRDTLML